MLPFLLGTVCSGLVDIPTMILVSLAGCFTLCGCVYCSRMRLRNCCCCKCFLRAVRYDNFDDFELRVMLHEASAGHMAKKTYMKISAGNHVVKSERSGTGKFFEKLDIFVEQGTSSIKFDLMDTAGNCLATLKLNPSKDVLEASYLGVEHTFNMKANHKGVVYPKLTLTMFVNTEMDVETPLIEGGSADLNILLLQHISKTASSQTSNSDAAVSEIQTLREAGSGRAELFRGIGKTESVYLAILGPPLSRRWTLGLWPDIKSFQTRKASIVEVNMLKIGSIRADSIRSRVFVVNYFDELKVQKKLTLRAVDTSRDVWVEMLTHLVNIAHDQREEMKEMRGKRSPRH